jgi:hypothetical protein
MLNTQQLQDLRQAYRRHDFYLTFASENARSVLEQIIEHPQFPGSTDTPVLTFLATMLQIMQPRRVLQHCIYLRLIPGLPGLNL